MDVLKYFAKSLSRVTIPLGRQLDHDVREIHFDCSAWLNRYPEGVLIGHATPARGETYAVGLEMQGTTAIWKISDFDTAQKGYGKFQLELIGPDDESLHSAIAQTIVLPSLSAKGSGAPPEVLKPWIDEITQMANGSVRFDDEQNLTEEQKATARKNIGVGGNNGTGGVSEEDVFELLNKWGVIQSLQDSDDAYITDDDGSVLTYERDISGQIFATLQRFGLIHSIVDGDGSNVADYDSKVLIYDK